MLVPDLYVFTLKFLAYKKRLKHEKKNFQKEKKNYLSSMQLFSSDATMFSKKNFFFAHKKLKKPPSKVAHNRPQTFFSCTGPAAQTSPELMFHVINMSQDASVLLSVGEMHSALI